MFAKVIVLLTVFSVAYSVAVGGPWLGAGHLGAVSAQSTAINHVAPAASLGYAGGYGLTGGPLAYGHGLAGGYGNGLAGAYGHGLAGAYGLGLAGAPLAYGHGTFGGRYGSAWGLGHGAGKVW